MERHLKRGEYKEYVFHLANIAGIFIAMGEEIAHTLLTEDEQEEMEGKEGLPGDLLTLMHRDVVDADREDDGDSNDRSE